MRICSFLPSATEMVYDLGLQDQLFGVTHECDYPPEARNKPHGDRTIEGSTFFPDLDQIMSVLVVDAPHLKLDSDCVDDEDAKKLVLKAQVIDHFGGTG